jgi:hypothetical protein
MVEAAEEVGDFRSTFYQLFERADRKVDVDGRHEVDISISTVSVDRQEIAATVLNFLTFKFLNFLIFKLFNF